MQLLKVISHPYISWEVGFQPEDFSPVCSMISDMKILTLTIVVAAVTAAPSGLHPGVIVSGPSGVVTDVGAVGPAALGIGPYGAAPGRGGAYLAGPAVSHASIVGPAAGYGGLAGLGGPGPDDGYGPFDGVYGGRTPSGYEGGYAGSGVGVAVTNGGGTVGVGPHGVSVRGPPTVPATISGPAGHVVAHGLYGVPTHGHGW